MCTDHASISRRDMLRASAAALAGSALLPQSLRALIGSSPRADLEVALRAERWIRASRIQTPNGAVWPADPLKPASVAYDLHNGMPGVVLFYLELCAATDNRGWLEEARAGANEIVARVPEMAATNNCGLYTGVAGCAFVLEEAHRATGEGQYRAAAKRALDAIHAQARSVGAGAAWSGESATNDIISGSAGIGLFLLWADERLRDPRNRAAAIAAGRRLIEVAQLEHGGLKWAVAPNVQNQYPNFSHGTAGVSYFLATLYKATGDKSFLDAALAGATYLRAVADTEGNTFKVFHHEPGGEQLFYLSWCHGPAGLSRLFYRLGEVTGGQEWEALVTRAAAAIEASGVPEQRTPGFWNNISQCCGNCGVGEHFLTLDRLMPSDAYGRMARRVGGYARARRPTATG